MHHESYEIRVAIDIAFFVCLSRWISEISNHSIEFEWPIKSECHLQFSQLCGMGMIPSWVLSLCCRLSLTLRSIIFSNIKSEHIYLCSLWHQMHKLSKDRLQKLKKVINLYSLTCAKPMLTNMVRQKYKLSLNRCISVSITKNRIDTSASQPI